MRRHETAPDSAQANYSGVVTHRSSPPVDGPPRRVQRSRAKGWRTPPDAVYVGRPTVYGNPFRISVPFCGPTIRVLHDRAESVAAFRDWLRHDELDPLCW